MNNPNGFVFSSTPTHTDQAVQNVSGALTNQINALGKSAKSVIDSASGAVPVGIVTAGSVLGGKVGGGILKKISGSSEDSIMGEAKGIANSIGSEANSLFSKISKTAETIVPKASEISEAISSEGALAAGGEAIGGVVGGPIVLAGVGAILGGVLLDQLVFK
jgi:hypothetical protein